MLLNDQGGILGTHRLPHQLGFCGFLIVFIRARPLAANAKLKLIWPVCISHDIIYLINMEFFEVTENLFNFYKNQKRSIWGKHISSFYHNFQPLTPSQNQHLKIAVTNHQLHGQESRLRLSLILNYFWKLHQLSGIQLLSHNKMVCFILVK